MERYTSVQIARLLSHFHIINGMLFGKSQSIDDTYPIQTEDIPRKHASSVASGKDRAQKKEELLCMMLDLENGLKVVDKDVRRVLLNHFVYETEIISRERRGYLRSCLRRLTSIMNNGN